MRDGAKRLLASMDGGYSNPPSVDDGEEGDKLSLCKDMIAAFKDGDADALCECLEAFIYACEDEAKVSIEVR